MPGRPDLAQAFKLLRVIKFRYRVEPWLFTGSLGGKTDLIPGTAFAGGAQRAASRKVLGKGGKIFCGNAGKRLNISAGPFQLYAVSAANFLQCVQDKAPVYAHGGIQRCGFVHGFHIPGKPAFGERMALQLPVAFQDYRAQPVVVSRGGKRIYQR